MEVQKQPLRNCFGQYFELRRLFLVYTHTFIKYFSTELSFKSSTRIFCLYPQNRYLQELLAASVSIYVSIIE